MPIFEAIYGRYSQIFGILPLNRELSFYPLQEEHFLLGVDIALRIFVKLWYQLTDRFEVDSREIVDAEDLIGYCEMGELVNVLIMLDGELCVLRVHKLGFRSFEVKKIVFVGKQIVGPDLI